jgi:hypothetical protein
MSNDELPPVQPIEPSSVMSNDELPSVQPKAAKPPRPAKRYREHPPAARHSYPESAVRVQVPAARFVIRPGIDPNTLPGRPFKTSKVEVKEIALSTSTGRIITLVKLDNLTRYDGITYVCSSGPHSVSLEDVSRRSVEGNALCPKHLQNVMEAVPLPEWVSE